MKLIFQIGFFIVIQTRYKSKFMKLKRKKAIIAQVKASRKQSREEEIKTHGKSINYNKIIESKKIYSRKKNKAVTENDLPYSFKNQN